METQQPWKMRFSFKNATIVVCLFNVVLALFVLRSFLFHSSFRRFPSNNPISVRLQYMKESEEIRRAMRPAELIRRVREIQQEVYAEPETVQQKDPKQTAAVDLSKRLTDLRSVSDAATTKALEEWRKRKMERARQRELGKSRAAAAQA
ncbi:hypothetical protein Nepgr_030240 [Nepenthes gracilis]|uniref:Transmembrane protein n=1 Tax=Nepenthes gracilis TaxID=150966 RepID=A0AAD3TGN9_NEPGR|nr:hypothetical protein Nepgr_030240 [Nepenthes gracilis]